VAHLYAGHKSQQVHASQTEQTILLYMLDVLSGSGDPKNDTGQNKHGLLQGLWNMQSGMPCPSHNHDLI
jgi:hypothetical protein